MPPAAVPTKFAPWREVLGLWHDFVERSRVSPVQAAAAFALSFRDLDRVVFGADNEAQLREILDASQFEALTFVPDIYCEDERLLNPSSWNTL
jgi:hypothetical protein